MFIPSQPVTCGQTYLILLCSSLLSVDQINKSSLGNKRFICLMFYTIVHHWGTSRWNSKQEHGDRSWSRNHGGMPPTGCLPLACSDCLLVALRTYLPWVGTAHSELDISTSIINQERAPFDMPACQSDGGKPSIEVPSSQGTPFCVMLTKTNHTSIIYWTPKFMLRIQKLEYHNSCNTEKSITQ